MPLTALSFVWSIISSKFGIAGIGALAFMAMLGILHMTQAELLKTKVALVTTEGAYATERLAYATSEANRHTEYQNAKTALQQAASACGAQVAEARRSASVIQSIVSKPVATNPQTHCPVVDIVGSDELQHALHP
jgi:hypothetical protein